MNFEEYWASMVQRGFEDSAANRSFAASAWDAALCALTAKSFESGKLLEAGQVILGISELHTWVSDGSAKAVERMAL